ncbi:hypothetical protein GCM10028796_46810 [Ramlibacter monticola]|uniref:Uncharacterized protein n=1 Tax=Ramlibacter monticola TaxID=1926872 RepID=A0A937CVD6_9BURK|nr:hypothetical protein [Ramlibacter monticola]MBL0394306.1 hypothetical protein [Ramlibacter monticola]
MASGLDTTTGAPGADPALDEPQETSLRDDLDAAFQQHATDEVDDAPGRTRDELGRFAKTGEGEAPAKAPGGPQAAPQQPGRAIAPAGAPGAPQAPAAPELKAPASWTPTAREKWGTVDPELRAEIHRREGEAQRVLQESAGLRQFAQAFDSIVRPYEMFIRSENSDPLRAVQSLMNTAAELRVGTPQSKVNIVANIVRQHGIDLQMLDSALAQMLGVTDDGQAPQQQPLRDPRVDQILAYQQQQQYAQQQQLAEREAWEDNELRKSLASFAQTHEFYADVADTMADLIDAATRRGQAVDMEKIYARACQLDEQVSTILAQRAGLAQPTRNQQRGAPGPSQAVLRAKRAAVSVNGSPSPEGATVPKNDSIRSAIEAAFDAHAE